MKIIDPASIKKIKEARQTVADFQTRLLEAERRLDDLARCAEICMITNQFHLLGSFVDEANVFLEDRLDLIEYSERTNNFKAEDIQIVETKLSTEPT